MNLKANDYVSIALGAVVADVVIILLNYSQVLKSRELTKWYTTLGESSLAMDVLIIVLVTVLGVAASRALFKRPRLVVTAAIVVALQLLHDLSFAAAVARAPRGVFVTDVFKEYIKEVGGHALWGDSLMMVITVGVAEAASRLSTEKQVFALLSSIYAALFALHVKKPTH